MAWKAETVACEHRRISGGRFSRKYVCVCKPGKGGVERVGLVCDTDRRPSLFPSSKKSHFRDEYKCETFVVKMSFFGIIIKNHFHINGFALSLALKVRYF